MKRINIFLLFGLLGTSLSLQAQNLCSQVLKQAQKTYDEGRLAEIPDHLNKCLEKGFNKSEKIQAYRLIVLSYLFRDMPVQADSTYLKLLKTDPEYSYNPAVDPGEYIALASAYRNDPVFSIGITGGINRAGIRKSEAFGVENTASDNGKYLPETGVQIGLTADILLSSNFNLSSSLLFARYSFGYKNRMYGFSDLEYKENQNHLVLPVSVKYEFGEKKLRPFVEAGLGVSYLLSAEAEAARRNVETQSNEAVGPAFSMSEKRNELIPFLLAGAGVKQKLGYGYLQLNIKYLHSLKEVADPETAYSDKELLYKYGYIDDKFYLNNFMISVGYLKSIYKPKKLTKNGI